MSAASIQFVLNPHCSKGPSIGQQPIYPFPPADVNIKHVSAVPQYSGAPRTSQLSNSIFPHSHLDVASRMLLVMNYHSPGLASKYPHVASGAAYAVIAPDELSARFAAPWRLSRSYGASGACVGFGGLKRGAMVGRGAAAGVARAGLHLNAVEGVREAAARRARRERRTILVVGFVEGGREREEEGWRLFRASLVPRGGRGGRGGGGGCENGRMGRE